MVAAGHSGTPLAKKLSLKPAMRVWCDGMPTSVRTDIEPLDLIEPGQPEAELDGVLIFVAGRSDMESKLAMLRPLLAPSGFIWVSWPKIASKRPTDITETTICAVISAATNLVDNKICAVDAVRSGLKLVIRKLAR